MDCTTVLRSVRENLKSVIEERGAPIECKDLLLVFGDGSQLVQVFQNLDRECDQVPRRNHTSDPHCCGESGSDILLHNRRLKWPWNENGRRALMTKRQVEILLVADNPDDVKLTLHALQEEKLANRIHVARDGEEVLDFLFCTG